MRLWNFLSPRRRLQFFILLFLMLISGIAETISFTAVIPFLQVLTEPEKLQNNQITSFILGLLKINDPNDLLTKIVLFFIFISIVSGLIKLTNTWATGRFAAAFGSEISCTSFSKTLMQPYFVHISKKSSSIISTNTTYVTSIVTVLHQCLWFISNSIISFLIVIGLLIINKWIALSLLTVFGTAYLFITTRIKIRLMRNSRFISEAIQRQIKSIQESLGSIRDIILDKNFSTFIDVYKEIDIKMRLKQADSIFISIYPRNILEVIGIIFLVLAALIINQREIYSINQTLPILGAFALGAQKLLPAMQQSYNAWATINGYSSELSKVLESLEQNTTFNLEQKKFTKSNKGLNNIKKNIKLENVSFKYGNELPLIIKNINLEIKKGERIGIKGSTGCGKSTLIDLIMGLLIPTSGRVLIDNDDIHKKNNLGKWQKNITHVPQNIYLTDSSFAENIAFGIPKKAVDLDRVKKVAEMAKISSFIESTQKGYNTFVGEAGINISGGQKQRIGIARALYKNAELIIFDEATSALDQVTENSVMQSINNIKPDVTIIFIAHRLSTLESCDKILELKNGNIFEI